MDDPDEAEASHEGIRLTAKVADLPGGGIEYDVSVESRNTKLRAPDDYLCVSVDAIPGFLALPVWRVLPFEGIPDHLRKYSKTPMHKLFGIRLESFD